MNFSVGKSVGEAFYVVSDCGHFLYLYLLFTCLLR